MPGDSKLRPYYDHDTFNAGYSVIFKPGIGLIDTSTQKEITSSFSYVSAGPKSNLLSGNLGINATNGARLTGSGGSDRLGASSDINYINDLELSEYFDYNNLSELLKNLVWNFFTNYCRVILSQPLDIVRLTLQVGYFNFPSSSPTRALSRTSKEKPISDETLHDEEEIDFFQPTSSKVHDSKSSKHKSSSKGPQKIKNPHKIHPTSQHTVDIMTAILSKDGPFALFRGINASFIHYTLSHTIEAWITGFISPFLNIPDPFFLDLTHSTEPAKSLWLSVSACILTGVILMPLDLIRVRLMMTPINIARNDSIESTEDVQKETQDESTPSSGPDSDSSANKAVGPVVNPRSVRDSLRYYPSRLLISPPPLITVLTVLYQISTIVFRKSAPYFLFVRYNIDSYSSPNLFTMANLVLSITEFFIKLPVENLLRKEQVRFLLKPKSLEEDEFRVVTIDNPEENLVVDFDGWDLKHSHPNAGEESGVGIWRRIKYLGLFRGWRLGLLNVIGFWGYNIVKSTSVVAEERL